MNSEKQRIYPWIIVFLLWGVALLNYLDRQMLSTMKEAMQCDIYELQQAVNFGHLMAVFLWIYGFMSPIAGIIADKINRKWMIVGSLFVWSAVTYGMGYANTFTQIYWLRALMGVSEALYIPAGLSLIADWHQGKTRSLAIGIHMTGLYMGQAIGGFGATIADAYSWHTTFHWFGFIGIAYSIVLILFLRENENHREVQKEKGRVRLAFSSVCKGLSMLMASTSFWVILFYFAIPSLPGWATKNWLPTLFSESLNIPMSKAGPISTITIAVSSFLGVIVGGIISDRWVIRNIRGRVYTGAIGVGLTVPALLLLGYGHLFITEIGAGIMFGFGFGMFDANNMPILCQFVSTRYRATAYGIMNMAGVFSGALITSILGKWTDSGNLGMGFALLGIIVVFAVGFQLYFLHPQTDNME